MWRHLAKTTISSGFWLPRKRKTCLIALHASLHRSKYILTPFITSPPRHTSSFATRPTSLFMPKRSSGTIAGAEAAAGAPGATEIEPLAAAAAEAAAAITPTKPAKKRQRADPTSPHVRDNLKQLKEKAASIAEHLRKLYPEPAIPLDHASEFQLLCAVVLSAQTTDKKVNEVTPALFKMAPDAAAMAATAVADIAACIRTLGLAPTKAKNLQALSEMLVSNHSGAVPNSFELLEALPGVGHKTASVVMSQVHNKDAFPVDTHIHRLAQRWGLTAGKNVEQTEADLKLLFPSPLWRDLHLQIIYFGREKCPARGHDPQMCPICCWAAVQPYDKPNNSPLKASGKGAKAKSGGAATAAAKTKKGKEEEGDGDEGKGLSLV